MKQAILNPEALIKPQKLIINTAYSYLKHQPIENEKTFKQLKKDIATFKEPNEKIVVKTHAVDQWNDRVGPKTTNNVLQQLFEDIWERQRHRITLTKKDVGVLDDEIVFIYEVENNELIIKTMYGRISLNHHLHHEISVRNYNAYEKERINLKIPEDILNQQKMPMMPASVITYEGQTTNYRMEMYYTTHQEAPIYFHYAQRKGQLGWERYTINMMVANQRVLPKTTLAMLVRLGHLRFIFQYLKHFNPEKIKKIEEDYSNRAIRRFLEKDIMRGATYK